MKAERRAEDAEQALREARTREELKTALADAMAEGERISQTLIETSNFDPQPPIRAMGQGWAGTERID